MPPDGHGSVDAAALSTLLQAGQDHLRAGRLDAAAAALQGILAVSPTHPDALHLMGLVAKNRNQPDEALRWFSAALAVVPGHAPLLFNLANLHRLSGRAEDAIDFYLRSLAVAPGHAETHHQLGTLLLEQDSPAEAIAPLASAAALAPERLAYWLALERCLQGVAPARLAEPLLEALRVALRREVVDARQLPNLTSCSVSTLPCMRRLVTWARAGTLSEHLVQPESLVLLQDAHLIEMLARVRVLGVDNELVLRGLRSWLLGVAVNLASDATDARVPALAPFAQALAIQCFAGDYAYQVAEPEEPGLERLRAQVGALESFAGGRWLQAVVLACYQPLHRLPNREVLSAFAAAHPDPMVQTLVRIQVDEPRRELALRATVERFGAIEDEVSRAVQAQYEVNPFPRWTTQPNLLAGTFDRSLIFLIKELVEHPAPRILIAGCGTGRHPMEIAMSYPHAEVVAIDLSSTSLAYALRKVAEAGLTNLRFWQGDLLQIAALGQEFDAIESVGVLHHLREPLAGWRALDRVLKPGGWMKVGLYSASARRSLSELRRRLAAAGTSAGDDGIRHFRGHVLSDQSDPHHRRAALYPDFYNLSECRDLLFHAQEHQFTIPELGAAMAELGVEFQHFVFSDLTAIRSYQRRFPTDPAMRDLERWAELERAEPDTFVGMYQFWVRKPP